ncbi:MAG: hypothetical protein KGP10_00665 [Actinomycetales bacterium]|nr:hypothetical protein [Actinomycetales bacterium]
MTAAARRPWADAADRWLLRQSDLRVQRAGRVRAMATVLRLARRRALERDWTRIADALDCPAHWDSGDRLPPIAVFIPCHPRDVPFLIRCLPITLAALANPVAQITIAVPGRILPDLRTRISALAVPSAVTVLDEADLLPSRLRADIAAAFPERAGWLTAQALKLTFAADSQHPGVLQLDADTVLTHRRAWLSADGRQPLLPTYEWHPPYYRVLTDLGLPVQPNTSYIAHHMLHQPAVLSAILAALGCASVSDLLHRTLSQLRAANDPAASLDYELYAHGLMALAPERVVRLRWANVPMAPGAAHGLLASPQRLAAFGRRFASLSAHGFIGQP